MPPIRSTRRIAVVLLLSLLAPLPAAAQDRGDVAAAEAQVDAALLRVREADARLQTALAEYDTVNSDLGDLTFRMAETVQRIRDLEADTRALRGTVRGSIVAAYVSGRSDHFSGAFEADTIHELFSSRVILAKAVDLDTAALERLGVVRSEARILRDELDADRERSSRLRDLAEASAARLAAIRLEAVAAYDAARIEAAGELAAYEKEVARLAAVAAARRRGPAAGVGEGVTPGFTCPVLGSQFIDSWGFPRPGGRTHKGADMFAARGTAAVAAAPGVVRLTSNNLGGTVAFLVADHGVTYYYAHLDGYPEALETGDRVEAGQPIGYVGTTGNAIGTSPHLHFQLHPGHGAAVNPYSTLRRHC